MRASCNDPFESGMLPAKVALREILAALEPVRGRERVALHDALDRVLIEDIASPVNVPAHTNSAVDGFALRLADLPASGVTTLRIAGEAYAGHPYPAEAKPGECVRVMTGAIIPTGADTVVMKEDTEAVSDGLRLEGDHKKGANIRDAGEDIKAGDTVLQTGRLLTPADIGMLGSLGLAEVDVARRLRVAFASTGDELRSLGQAVRPGEIYDSNRFTLLGMLKRLHADVVDLGVIPDQREALRQAFTPACKLADVFITSGGVSVGEADYVKEILQELGEIGFWKIAIKPGRPLAFGKLGRATFFGLPGNPVAVMVTFYQFVKPALERMMGRAHDEPFLVRARAESDLEKRRGRTEFQRGILQAGENGELVVTKTGQQGSGVLSSMSRANCFIVLDDDAGPVRSGDTVMVQPFAALI
ncbi:MAG: molybdopterin molybdotransferase MoeA [Gammaproteobacteria bacterium]